MEIEVIKEQVIRHLRNIYDPEIPVNIYDLGLIYGIEFRELENGLLHCDITMTLTSAACPASEVLYEKVNSIARIYDEIEEVKVDVTFDPPWDQSKMSDEAKLQLGMM